MALCPFLTTSFENVDCFNDCVFKSSLASGEECPFRYLESMEDSKGDKVSSNFKDILDEEESSFIKLENIPIYK